MKRFSLLAILLMLFGGCQQQTDIAAETDRLLQTDREFSQQSVARGAANAFRAYLLEDALQLPAGQLPINGRDAIYQDMRNAGGGYTLSWEPQAGEVATSGDLGYTWGVYTLTIDSGDSHTRRGKYLNVWKKDGEGNWRVLIDMGNSNPPLEDK